MTWGTSTNDEYPTVRISAAFPLPFLPIPPTSLHGNIGEFLSQNFLIGTIVAAQTFIFFGQHSSWDTHKANDQTCRKRNLYGLCDGVVMLFSWTTPVPHEFTNTTLKSSDRKK